MTDKLRPPAPPSIAVDAPQQGLALVLDTNVLLDLWLFQDARLAPLREALRDGRVQCLATPAMRVELAHVRERPFPPRYSPSAEWHEPPCLLQEAPQASAPWRCRDRSDQKFLDLAWQARCPVWTRDRDLLALRRRAARDGIAIETPEAGWARLQP